MDNSSFSWGRFERNTSFSQARQRAQNEAHRSNHDDLFVFGYSCKLYRDEEKFRMVNACQHLIPWMGQENLLVDRYDVRGYLNDLAEFERKPSNTLNHEEVELENRLNEERFADLKCDSPEPDNRLHEKHSQVNYQYDQEIKLEDTNNGNSKDDIFKVPHGLHISPNMILPTSNKHHFIIEKTAMFVAQQGSQMEILLKTKQASNSNFDFLSIDSELNPFYKFLLGEIKSGRYVPKESNGKIESDSESDDDDNYLHPSLLSSQKASTTQDKLNIKNLFSSKHENDSTYSQLVKNFKDKFADDIAQDDSCPEKISNVSISQSSSNSAVSSLIPQPPKEAELIISKLAQHVSKNGEDFESSIKALNDKKFDFLNPGHIYHPYYVKQKIRFRSEAKQQHKQPKRTDSVKLITFSITPKESSKKNCLINSEETAKELNDYVKPTTSVQKEVSHLSKEKQLQEERKRKARDFLKMLRKENRLEESLSAYGPDLPKSKDPISLSPTIEEVTSPTHSPTFADYETLSSEVNKKSSPNNASLLPFTSNDKRIKDRSLSPKHRHSLTNSPPKRYRLRDEKSSHKKSSSHHRERDRQSSKKHRHRSRSKERHRSKHKKARHYHKYSSSSSRSSRSRSPTPKTHKSRSKRHASHRSKSR